MAPIIGGPGGGGPPVLLLAEEGVVPLGLNTSTYFDLRFFRLFYNYTGDELTLHVGYVIHVISCMYSKSGNFHPIKL